MSITIESENLKAVRQAMDIDISIDETADKPTSLTGANILTDFEANAKADTDGTFVKLMDLSGTGFPNDGTRSPASATELPGSEKYGYISAEVAKADGTFDNPPQVTIEAEFAWEYITLTLMDAEGNASVLVKENIEWESGETTVTIDSFTPGKRPYITKVSLGKSWQFNNDNLVSLDVTLRGPNTSLDEASFDLGMSEVECSAYIGEDADRWIEVFARMEKYSPCQIQIGYPEDNVSRTFYISEQVNYDKVAKTLTVKMADATVFLDDNYAGAFVPATTSDVRQKYYDTIRDMLTSAGIKFTESGTVPTGAGTGASNLFFANETYRSMLAKACNVFRNPDIFALTYRDAGNPELIAGQSPNNWTINEADISEFATDIEMSVKQFKANLTTCSKSGTIEELATVEGAVAGQTYFVEASEPYAEITSATKGTPYPVTPYTIKFVCTSSGDAKINGYKITTATATGDDPRSIPTQPTKKGIEVTLDDCQKINYGVTQTSDLPAGYTPLEYIQSSGTQYINLGIVPTINTKVELDYVLTSTAASKTMLGSRDSNNAKLCYQFTTNSSSNYNFKLSPATSITTGKSANTIRTQMSMGNGSVSLIGGQTYSATPVASGTTTYPLYLFCANQNGTATAFASMKVYGLVIYEEGTEVRHLYPCKNSSDVVGLYDTVSETFFANDGSGTFTAGPEQLPVDVRSLTVDAVDDLLGQSNLIYSWKWRGNPHWKPMDHVVITPIIGDPIPVTLQEVNFSFEGGGLVSECIARGGLF